MVIASSIIIEQELKKFSWLAFWCPLYWAICNRIWEVVFVALLICMPFVPDQIGRALILILSYWTGKTGNKLAWQKRKWESLEHFKNTQKKYAHIGLWILFVIILLIVAFILGVASGTNALND